ncbi:MAG TPA: hypothetical protein VGB75_14080 [Jatrophihabitans sp.]|jgi:hypothetical protein|uniref:hypothetical protein n=1 Tax=Jatrophihabitans sp. TaxID=1932789 RepID=UPI002F0D061B
MALSEEENSQLAETEQELAADRMLSWLFTAAFTPLTPDQPAPGPARRMLCSRPPRRRR